MAVLGYLAKLEWGLRLAFGAHFLHDFSVKCSVFNTLSMDKVSMSQRISFSRCQTKCVIKFLFRQLMTSKTLRFLLNQLLKQWLTEKKREEEEYLEDEKSFLDEIKNIFNSF